MFDYETSQMGVHETIDYFRYDIEERYGTTNYFGKDVLVRYRLESIEDAIHSEMDTWLCSAPLDPLDKIQISREIVDFFLWLEVTA